MRRIIRNKLYPMLCSVLLCACMQSGLTSEQAALAVKNGCEWPEMQQVTDEYILSEYFGITAGKDDVTVYQCPAGAVMSEIIVIRSDDPSAALGVLEKRRTKAIERDALYPESRRIAESSVVGVYGDYAYFIMGENAAQGENVLLDALSQ